MLSGLKFIIRDEIVKARDEDSDESRKVRTKSRRRTSKDRKKKWKSGNHSSDEDLEMIKKGSRKKKKWYASDEDLFSDSDDASDSEHASDYHGKKHRSKGREENKKYQNSEDKSKNKARNRRRDYSSEEDDSYDSEGGSSGREKRCDRKGNKRREKDGGDGSQSHTDMDISRKEMGLEWMLKPKDSKELTSPSIPNNQPEEDQQEEIKKVNPRELNPYLKNNGSGYPEESDRTSAGKNQLLSSALVGDGGASWRLKALKRAREQAAHEGRKLDEAL